MLKAMIVGSPRSGTSWLGAMFDYHPQVLYLHEPDVTDPGREFPRLFPHDDWQDHLVAAASYLDRLAALRHLRAVSKQPFARKSYRSAIGRVARGGLIRALGAIERVPVARGLDLRRLPVPDFARLDAAHTVIKAVDSVPRLPAFAAARPDVRFIYIIRHPCGHVSSLLKGQEQGKFGPTRLFPEQFQLRPATRRGVSWDDAEKLQSFERLTWRWLVLNEWALEETAAMPNVLTVAYDRLAENPLAESRRIFEWVGLAWDRSSETFIRSNISETPGAGGYYSVKRHPGTAANAWRSDLTETQIARIMAIAGDSAPGRLTRGEAAVPVPTPSAPAAA